MTAASRRTSSRRALGDYPSGVHADEAVDDLEQHVDDVFDPDDGDALRAQLVDRRDQLAASASVSPPPISSSNSTAVWWPGPGRARVACGATARGSRRAGSRPRRGRTAPALRCTVIGVLRAGRPRKTRRRRRSRTRSSRRRDAGSGGPARCRAAARRGLSRPAPRKLIVPSGRSEPASTFSSVVLPAPFGPTMPTASPARPQVDVVEHRSSP